MLTGLNVIEWLPQVHCLQHGSSIVHFVATCDGKITLVLERLANGQCNVIVSKDETIVTFLQFSKVPGIPEVLDKRGLDGASRAVTADAIKLLLDSAA